MSALAVAVEPYREPPRDRGYFRMRRGLPEDGPLAGEPMWSFRSLMRRAGSSGYCVMTLIISGAQSPGSGGYGSIDLDDDAIDVGVSARQVRGIIDDLLAKGLIERHVTEPWSFRPCYEAFDAAPIRPLIKKPREGRKEPAREVHYAAPESEMHFTQRGEPSADPKSEIHFTSLETDCRKPETYCPWNWPCPHLSNDLVDLKNVELIELKASKHACRVGTDLINPMPRRPRDDSSDAREDTQENNPVLGACTPRRVRGEMDASSPVSPGNGDAIQYWLSRQPWGAESQRTGKAPLTEGQLRPVLAKLAEWGWKDIEFTEAMRERGERVLKDRDNITGVLIDLITGASGINAALPRKPIPPANAPSNRLTRAADIQIP